MPMNPFPPLIGSPLVYCFLSAVISSNSCRAICMCSYQPTSYTMVMGDGRWAMGDGKKIRYPALLYTGTPMMLISGAPGHRHQKVAMHP